MITVDSASSVPPYEQVRAQFARDIASGRLPAGFRLPTVRGLATELQLAANTVARAYRELEEAGLIVTRGRAGTVVSAQGDQSLARASSAAAAYTEQVRALGISDEDALRLVATALDLL